MGNRSRKDLLLSVGLLFASLLLSAAAVEIGLRLLGFRGQPEVAMRNVYRVEADRVLDWRYAPNTEFREGRVLYRFNSAGFRDAERSVTKPDGRRRIVVVGDSVTEARGVPWKSAFSSRVQLGLGPEYEVITIAQGGLNTPQEVHLLAQSGVRYRPDLVVLNFVLNDCDFYSQLAGAGRYVENADSRIGLLFNMPVNAKLKQTLKSSAFIYFVKGRLENVKARVLRREYTDYYTRIWGEEQNRRKITDGFDALRELQAKHSFDTLVVIWPLITDYRRYTFAPVHEWVKLEAEKREFGVIDLFPDFAVESHRRLQVSAEDNVHPNELGHGIAARRFIDWFRSNGLKRLRQS